MHRTLIDFIKVLRNAEIQVSPAETLDAMHVLELIGTRNRKLLRDSLSIAVSKTLEEKEAFDDCFDRYFSISNYNEEKKKIASPADTEEYSEKNVEKCFLESLKWHPNEAFGPLWGTKGS